MKIIILCDQEDCIFNMLNSHHPNYAHHDHNTDKCTNKHPHFWYNNSIRHCGSKTIKYIKKDETYRS